MCIGLGWIFYVFRITVVNTLVQLKVIVSQTDTHNLLRAKVKLIAYMCYASMWDIYCIFGDSEGSSAAKELANSASIIASPMITISKKPVVKSRSVEEEVVSIEFINDKRKRSTYWQLTAITIMLISMLFYHSETEAEARAITLNELYELTR